MAASIREHASFQVPCAWIEGHSYPFLLWRLWAGHSGAQKAPAWHSLPLPREQHLGGGGQQHQRHPGGRQSAPFLQHPDGGPASRPLLRHLAAGGPAEPPQQHRVAGPRRHRAARSILLGAQQVWGRPDGAGAAQHVQPGHLQQQEGGWGPVRLPRDRMGAGRGRRVAGRGGAPGQHSRLHHRSR